MLNLKLLTITVHENIAHLHLNRPQKCNAMNSQFFDEFEKAMIWINAEDTIRVIVISGEGKHFSTGADVSYLASIVDEVQKQEEDKREHYLLKEIEKMQRAFSLLANSPKPSIAAIHGLCLGAGVDLIAACDIRIATKNSYFSILETKLGIPADLGTLQRLPLVVSDGIIKELAYTSKIFRASLAEKYGLLNHSYYTKKGMLKAAFSLAIKISLHSPYAVKSTKEAINFLHQKPVTEGLKNIAQLNAKGLQSEEIKKIMTEMKEKFK